MHVNGKFTDIYSFVKNILFLMALMTFGASGAWAQTDYSGTYYIASLSQRVGAKDNQYTYDSSNPANNFYLCPTEGWCSYKATDDFEAGDNNPFLTTYQCRDGVYDATKAVWIIEKASNSDYYYIKHKKDSKYLVSNGKIRTTTNPDRIRVHLEDVASDEALAALGDKALFAIYLYNNSHMVIKPMGITDGHELDHDNKTEHPDHKWLTVNNGHYKNLVGNSGKGGGPGTSGNQYQNTAGIVCIFTENDANGKFYLEDVITRPTIAFNSSDLIEITAAQTGSVTIKYTTDGTKPSRTNGNGDVYTEAFDPADNVTTIRAIAYGEDWESNIATFTPTVLCGTTHKRLIQSQNNNWTSGDHQGFHFYMIPGDPDNNSVLRVNTTSLFRPSMEWYFKSAGVEDGVQYYYIVNNANSKYLRCDGSGNVYLDTYSNANDNKFKFKLVESPTAGTYNIYPYGQNILINKNTNNANNGVINTANYSVDNTKSANTRWKFVTKSALNTMVPFTVSDGSSRTHYQLRCSGDEFYVKAPAADNDNATMVAAASADETTYWYLEKAADATDADWLTYYYILNAQTGKYLYYTGGSTSNNAAAFKTSADLGTGDELQRYQFAWARSTSEDYYFIVPKMVRDQTLNNFSTMDRSGTTLRVQKVRATGTSAWSFVPTHFSLDPVITQATDGTRTVTITCPTPGVDIYYRLDGEDPVVPAVGDDPTAPTLKYTAPFIPDVALNQIKVVAASATDRTAQSAVVTFSLPKYTYHIVNRSNTIAISSEALQQAAGTPLSGYSSIPTALQSAYISNETIQFYTMDGVFDANNLDNEHKITATPSGDADIYVTYTTDHLMDKFLHLRAFRTFNVKVDESGYKFLYDDNSGEPVDKEAATGETDEAKKTATKTTRPYMWYFGGNDPYAVFVQNVDTKKYLHYASPNLTLGASETFIMKGSDPQNIVSENGTGTVTLQNAAGQTISLIVTPAALPLSFFLIDKANKKIESGIDYTGSLTLPAAWQNPLCTYKFYKAATYNEGTDTYTCDEGDRIDGIEDLGDGNVIYVTYDVDNSLLDLDGRNSLGIDNKVNTAYRLQFAAGDEFCQESADAVMTEKRQAVFPYSNGDGGLYVYGTKKWEDQLASGASERTRWLWYIEPAKKLTPGVNTIADLDPYHVKISSYQTQTNYKIDDDNTRNFHSYLKTYAVSYGSPATTHIVTGVTNDNPLVTGGAESAEADNGDATEYMILGSSLSSLKLVTVDAISNGTTTERRTVNSFEQYWKNNPTVQGKLTTKVTQVGRNVTLSATQKTELETVTVKESPLETVAWHVYEAWANSQPWMHNNDAASAGGTPTTSKKFLKEEHVFQTIGMGDGYFEFVETEIKPMLILLDQHGWEIVRLPLPSGNPATLTDAQKVERAARYAELHKYSSPMVEKYHYWKTGTKVPGYHKYTVSDYATNSDGTEYTTDELGRADITASGQEPNLPNYDTQALVNGKERDWYVTYDVKADYASKYAGAATKGATSAAPYLIKQDGKYAQIDGTSLSSTNMDLTGVTDVPEEMQWYVRPNFDIDEELGYQYEGEYGELTKTATEAAYFAAGQNGFDPYNVQIQSVKTETRYFTANTSSSIITNKWAGSSSGITLENLNEKQHGIIGLDQVKMQITNATFMVVADDDGNMILMPRFDNTKVMQSFATLAKPNGSVTQVFTLTPVPKIVHNSSEISAMGGYYMLANDFTASGSIGTKASPFKGTIEGQIDKSFSVSAPFIAYADGATIKNVIIESASVSSGSSTVTINKEDKTALGAICNYATGATRIYNCGINGGTIGASDDFVGGIVGYLDGSSRVINCYSYANITNGTDVGGIVGYNAVATTAAMINAGKGTMVMNCMFYGDITGGSNKSPVYGGSNINNVHGGLNTFNYYAYEKLPTSHITNNKYNCALAVEDKYLTRFEIYRQLLNSNRRLAAYYATGDASKGQGKDNEMAKWVLDKTAAPYPILKSQDSYPSIINYDPINTFDAETGENVTRASITNTEENRNKGRKIGDLTVNISVGTGGPTGAAIKAGKSSITLVRTDKDFDDYNFNYDKVQLPYYNEVGTGNYTTDSEGNSKVVTGWKITGMSKDGSAHFDTGDKWGGYNFADRNSTDKDLFGTSGRIFSQGAYFDVPYGVTSITIEPYWGTAAFLADERLDVVYNSGYGAQSVSQLPKTFNNGKINIGGTDQTVHTSMTNALNALSGATVYDNAVVLVGNYHLNTSPSTDGSKKLTIMSIDLDEDNEPDYSLINHHIDRYAVCPIRFDFLNVPGTAQAQKPNGSTNLSNVSIFRTKGWFEITNTTLIYFTQFEYENKGYGKPGDVAGVFNDMQDKPLILLGGVFDQFVSTQNCPVDGHTQYIHVGGNAWFHEFGLGTHSDGAYSTPHPPVSVTGGDYDGFYLTGTYNQDAAVTTDNAECYISGGHFVEAAGASQEAINGDVRWLIYDADIENFFGGGVNAARPITGDVRVDIFNSHVGIYCGGPKFGDMQTGKTVTTNAEGCTFTKFFGGGYGGTSYSRKKYYDNTTPAWSTTLQGHYTTDRGKYFDGATTNSKGGGGTDAQYGKKGPGVATDMDYEFFIWSKGNTGGRFFVKFASFTLATCNDVTSSLKSCHVTENFYGGGSLGKVAGKATSVLDDCTVDGNVFGGGYSATLPKVLVRKAPCFTQTPNINRTSGMFEPATLSGTDVYEWKQVANLPANGADGMATVDGKNYLYTDVDLTALGQVDETDLTIKGNTLVKGKIFEADGSDTGAQTGGVFGGGDESAVNGNTRIDIQATATAAGNGILNVFGGGNTADVGGDAVVMLTGGTVGYAKDASVAKENYSSGDVYGGGKGAGTTVAGNVAVHIGKSFNLDGTDSGRTGTPAIQGSVYGGSALGNVNATKGATYESDPTDIAATDGNKTTAVNIYNGNVNGSVFGGGLGRDDEDPAKDIVAKNFGSTTVTMEGGTVSTAMYGGANVNGVLEKDTKVTITGGTVGPTPLADPIPNAVFGGGFGEPTQVKGSVEVNIGLSGQAGDGATINGHVYGGGALGNTNVNALINPPAEANTDVKLIKGTINGNVFGGGLGRKEKGAQALVLYENVTEYNTAKGTELTAEQFAVLTTEQKTKIPASDAETAVAAIVGGDVKVLLDGAKLKYDGNETPLTGQIFGANNLNGTPKGHVTVHVKKTVNVDSEKDNLKSNSSTPRDDRTTYDVSAVYGGGNQADYIPTDATITLPDPSDDDYATQLEKKNKACAEVIIEGCDKTSIEYVYGGGNAAAVPAADVTILGSYIIDYVFGGGNGKSTPAFSNPGANIGFYNNGATPYGSGKAVTKLVGCHAHYVFGGSNTKGNVRGGTSILMPEIGTTYSSYDCCTVRDIKEIYGAGNEAEQDGSVTLILGCVHNMVNVYGGARKANVKGGIDLVVTSGSFEGVFGGNDQSGTIQGPITLTIEETGCDPLEIDNLYLGGNQAAYSIYGYKNDGTARTKADYDALSAEDKTAEGLPYADPILNVVSCTRIGKTSGSDLGGAFGGGLGAGAIMYGSPTVNINMIPGKYAADVDSDNDGVNDSKAVGTISNVYGGGKLANVDGSTAVNIGTVEKMAHRTSMGAEIPVADRVQTDVQPAIITGNVFGAGKGQATTATDVDVAMVTGNTTIIIEKASITKSVYGGGELSQVSGDTHITVRGGTIGKDREETATPGEYKYYGGAEFGNVYGAGLGSASGVGFGLVKGNTYITIENTVADATWVEAHPTAGKAAGDVLSSPTIYHNIYGGGALACVGTFDLSTDDNKDTYSVPSAGFPVNWTDDKGKATITITGGTIGIDGHNNGMVFGSSRGDIDDPESIQDKLAWVHDTEVTIGTNGSATGPTLHGSLYGGGENGHVYHDASVIMYSGKVGNPAEYYAYRGNVYGAGCGTDKYYSTGEETHDGHGNYYNPNAGIVRGNTSITINGGNIANNVYGAGSMGKVLGSTSVIINTNGAIGVDGLHDDGNVYGAARGELDLLGRNLIPATDVADNYSSVTSTSVTLTKGTVKGSLYGGGKAGVVHGKVEVTLNGGTVNHDVYGGGALAKTNTQYDKDNETKKTYTTTVTMNGAGDGCTILGNLYGGGLGQLGVAGSAGSPAVYTAVANGTTLTDGETYYTSNTGAGEFKSNGTEVADGTNYFTLTTPAVAAVDAVAAVEADVNGPVTVTVSNGKAANVFGCNNLYGAPKQTVAVNIEGTVAVENGSAISRVFGGGNLAAYTGNPTVAVSGGFVNNVYGGGLGSTAVVTGNTSVTISGTSVIRNDVYGGGSQADVTGSVNVIVSGGTITNNVYGGGALANTNTANWDVSKLVKTYEQITKITANETVVTGLYKEVGDTYTLVSTPDAKAEEGAKYYKIFETAWADGKTSASNTTTVTLVGGKIGNAFGGGLGNTETPVFVYGDVSVRVNNSEDKTTYSGTGAAFTREIAQNIVVGGKNYPTVPTTGSIFGANNFNGTPKGNVTVEIWGTKREDGGAHALGDYEVQAVYGGGNMASYLPAADKVTKVIIHGCSDTSIEKVYGGGNSASVPTTDVTIEGAFDIGYAFAGGNGSMPVRNSAGTWLANAGAMIHGNSKIVARGGRIGDLFGGSDAKGDVLGDPQITKGAQEGETAECDLSITRIFGAGNEGNVTGDVNYILSGCGTADAVQFVHGGSYNAHISGNVNMTITSGFYTNVFGGNDARGSIGGNITIDIEETDACKPIIIHNLIGGGNEAAYPGIKADGTEITTPGSITINIKSATRIDNIYGGGLKSDVKGNVKVNINMRKGSMVNTELLRPASYTGDVIPNVHVTEGHTYINDAIGTIGYIFGGGNEGNVIGDAIVNIGTEKSVKILRRDGNGKFIDASNRFVYDNEGKLIYDEVEGQQVARTVSYEDKNDVLGANITGNVYGGGNLADVKGNTYVNICAKESATPGTYEAVAFGVNDVKIGGDVFGGGKGIANSFQCEKAMVGVVDDGATVTGEGESATYTLKEGGTTVNIGHGTIGTFDNSGNLTAGGNVYGGGEVGRVERNTKVTIGFGDGAAANAKSPVIGGYVFGAGQGVPTHGYSGLVRGNSTVTIQGDAKVGHSVYGAGKLASLGRYWIATDDTHGVEIGMPYGLKCGGKSTVVIQGYAEIGPNNMTMPTFDGNVFAGGKGVLPYEGVGPEGAGRYYMNNSGQYLWESYAGDDKETAYLKYIKTLGITETTDVTIAGNAFIKGSVYGGSENGHVRQDTHVMIAGNCQIGNGKGKNVRYTTAQWNGENPSDFTECASWDYGKAATADKKHDPYDKYSNTTGDDGHTFYGNVFGGGSGYFPYKSGKWNPDAGVVGGNTVVDITGGHILTSIYGGNEMTDVKGKCTVNMVGGTLGVPRTLKQIHDHPVTCYLFGAGKGDQRVLFNTWTNVASTNVTVSGGIIYGSVFGGGEDGHVLGDVTMTIGGSTKIGTWGTSYVDGNIFGGGRGFSGDALTAGSVGGNVTVNITGGTMLGSIYGGGRLASVGTFFVNPESPHYGQLQEDFYIESDDLPDGKSVGDAKDTTHGHIKINISGGSIGNGIEGTEEDKGYFDIAHSGNVFGGSMGRIELLDGTTNPIWPVKDLRGEYHWQHHTYLSQCLWWR